MRRAVLVAVAVLVGVGIGAGPAEAHTRASSATSFDSRITSAPDLPGLAWRVYPGGEYLELVNDSSAEVVVLGYDGEPYLRIGPAGVLRNRNSPATYLNAERLADVAVPPRADPDAAPDWEHVSDGARFAWHDHRVHWMAPDPPEVVRNDSGTRRLISEWEVPFTYADDAQALAGALWWEPGTNGWAWLLLGLALTAPALLGLRGRGPPARVVRPAAAVVAAVAMTNLIHLPDEVLALPLPALDVLFGLFHNVLFIGVGLTGAWFAWRGRAPLVMLGIGSAAVAFHQGLLQVAQLSPSQLSTVWPSGLIRLAVAASIGQAVWTATALITAARRADPEPEVPPEPMVLANRADRPVPT